MVGNVIFKNFETGSYREIKLVAYNGTAYADIGKGEFFSCRVNLSEKSIVYDFVSSEDAPCRSMSTVLFAAEKAREYLYRNPYVTAAEFCLNYDECVLRPLSCKPGVYEPADFKSLFNDSGFYKLVSEFKSVTPLWRFVLCEGINFCVQRIFGTSESIYSTSSYGIYINVSVFPRSVYKVLGLPGGLRKLANTKNTVRMYLKPRCTGALEFRGKPANQPFGRIVYLLSLYRIKCINRFMEILEGASSKKDMVRCIVSLPEDEYIVRLTDDFAGELSDFALSCFGYGCPEVKSHRDMLTLREVLLLAKDSRFKREISRAASARSANNRLLNKLPCPAYFDSDGTAIWK